MEAEEAAKEASNKAGDDNHMGLQSSLWCSCLHLHQHNCTLLLLVLILVRLLVLCEYHVLRQHKSNHWCQPLFQIPQNTRSPALRKMPLDHLHNNSYLMLRTQCHSQGLQWLLCLCLPQGQNQNQTHCRKLCCFLLQESLLQRSHNSHRHHSQRSRRLRCPCQPLQL